MIYPTLRATVHNGKIQLLEDIKLPEDAAILVTIMDENSMSMLTAGEKLAAGLQDILLGRITKVNSAKELSAHLDAVFGDV